MDLNKREATRDYSIDLIRIISMFGVLCLHCLNFGGLYQKGYEMGGVNFYSTWFTFIHSLSCISVNLFVLISGYFLCNQKFKTSKLIRLVCEVVFYSWTFLAIRLYFEGFVNLNPKAIITALLPVSYVQYWFVSAYVSLYVLTPVLNLLIKSVNQRQHFGIIVVLVCLFSILNTILPLSQVVGVKRFGQSMVWFVVLYMIGAFIKLYIDKNKLRNVAKRCFWVSILLMNVTWIIATLIAVNLHLDLFNEKVGTMLKYYFQYDSLPVLIASVSAFHWLRGVNINSSIIRNAIKRVSPLVFGVYLIHCNYYIVELVWKGITDFSIPNPFLPIYALIYTIMIYIICLMIDYIRYIINSVLTRNWSNRLYNYMDKGTYSFFDKLYNYYLRSIDAPSRHEW